MEKCLYFVGSGWPQKLNQPHSLIIDRNESFSCEDYKDMDIELIIIDAFGKFENEHYVELHKGNINTAELLKELAKNKPIDVLLRSNDIITKTETIIEKLEKGSAIITIEALRFNEVVENFSEVYFENKSNLVQSFIAKLPIFAAVFAKITTKDNIFAIDPPAESALSLNHALDFLHNTQDNIIKIFSGHRVGYSDEEALFFVKSFFLSLSYNGDKDKIKFILEHAADDFIKMLISAEIFGLHPLFLAAESGHTEIVKMLLDVGSDIGVRENSFYKETPLYTAAEAGHVDIVRLLIDAGSDLDVANLSRGYAALYAAIEKANIKIVKMLIEAGADVNIPDVDDNYYPIHSAARTGNLDLVKMLIDAGSDVNSGEDSVLDYAIESGNTELIMFLIDNFGGVNNSALYRSRPLHIAAKISNIDICKLLIMKGCDVNKADNYLGDTPLHEAVSFGNEDSVVFLLEAGANINATNDIGETALDNAIDCNEEDDHINVIKILLNHKDLQLDKEKTTRLISDMDSSEDTKSLLLKMVI
jgi:ankyrin repeat protein